MWRTIANGIKIQKTVLQVAGLWPTKNPSLYVTIAGWTSVITSIIFVATLIAELCKHFKNYVVFNEHLSLIISPTSFLIKLLMFRRKNDEFVKLYQKLGKEIFNKHLKHLILITKTSARTSTVIGVTYMVTCFFVCLLFCASPLYTKADMPVRFSYYLGPYKTLMAIFQVFCMFNAALSNSSLDVIAMSVMGIAASQIEILNQKIINFKKDCDKIQISSDFYVRYLNHCVKHHNEIIRFVEDIEEVFSMVFLAQYLTSGALICNIGFRLVHINSLNLQFVNTVFYFAAMMGQLGMYCWYGNEVIVKSMETKNACYESDWTDCDLKVKKILIIIMERSKRPLSLTAAKFSVLSLNSFTTVVNTSYTYFALMQKLYNKIDN